MSTSTRPVSPRLPSLRRLTGTSLAVGGLLAGLLFPTRGAAQGVSGAPLTVSEMRALTAGDGAASADFGAEVSLSGNLAAVGAYGADSGRGAVYLFARNQGGADQWDQVRRFVAPNGQRGDHFGFAVSLSGDTLAVGAPESDEWGADAGMVYVFERNIGGADQWGLLCQVAAAEVNAGDHFGYSVSLDLNLLAVGAHSDQVNGVATGAAYVFHRNNGNGWFRNVMRLTAPDGAAGDRFGTAVALSGDRVVVGAHMDDNEQGGDAGAAYLFSRDWGGYNQWGLIRKMKGDTAGDHFGRAVAMRGSLVLVGAPSAAQYGRAYLYERNQNGPDGWGWIKTLSGSAEGTPRFGTAVAVSAQMALVGAPDGMSGSLNSGAVHVFARDEGGWRNWGQRAYVTPVDAAADDAFGGALALDGSRALVGAQGDDPQGEGSGSARLVTWTGNRWYLEAKLTPPASPHPRVLQWFGSSVDLDDGWLAAGAPQGHTYLGSTPKEPGRAATFLFQRRVPGSNRSWTTGQKVVYALAEDDDRFGAGVAMDGGNLVVGAPSDTQGLGMAYAFERNRGGADAWGESARLNDQHRHNDEMVGQYVALDGDVLMLGSRGSVWEDYLTLIEGVDMPVVMDSATGGNTYIYCRDVGGQSGPWRYVERKAQWTAQNVVAVSGNTLVIGDASRHSRDASGSLHYGGVHVYHRNHGGKDYWGRLKTILPPGATREWGFGGAVALAGDTLAVGPDIPGVHSNPAFPATPDAVYIHHRNAGGADNWGRVREIRAPGTEDATGFGCALALTDDVLAVGACGATGVAGAVFLFERNRGGADQWGLAATLRVPDNWPWSWFGQNVSLEPQLLAVGAPGDDHEVTPTGGVLVTPRAGAVYVYHQGNNHPPVMAGTLDTYLYTADEDAGPSSLGFVRVSTLVQRAQTTDPEGDVCGLAVVATNNERGQWQFSRNGGAWEDLTVTSAVNARLLDPETRIRFVPAPDVYGPVEPGLTFRAWDQTAGVSAGYRDARNPGPGLPFSLETAVLRARVDPVNDRPLLSTTGSPRLPDIWGNILDQYNTGQSVSNVLRGLVSDVDGDTCGLAVIGVSETSGLWQYSTDAGLNWRPLSGVRSGLARLLGPAARLRFVPEQNFSGTVAGGLQFLAWDQTTGSNGGLGNTQAGTAFSTATGALGITVTPVVNHAPLLDAFGDPVLPTIPRNATFNAGVPVSDLLGDWVEDVDGDACGIALTQTDTAHGSWQYSLNDGMTWSGVGSVSFASALLLGPDAVLRFVPELNYTGTVLPAVQYRAWDQTSGSEGSRVDARNGGGELAYSLVVEPAPITVSSDANRAPVLVVNNLQLWTSDVQEDDTSPAGDTVGALLASGYTDQDGHLCGIAVWGQDARHGVWQYRGPKEVSWLPMGTVSANAARLLGPTMQVRFVPDAGYNGTVLSGLSFRAWDRSAGTNGSLANLSPNGGATPYSTRTGLLGVRVVAANDAPVLLTTRDLAFAAITENEFNPPGTLVSNLVHRLVTDADRDVCGIAVIGLNETSGLWEYSLDAGAPWTAFGGFRGNHARLLGPGARVRMVPDADFHGVVTNGLRLRAWDQTTGTNGGPGLVVLPGGRSAYSAVDRWASIEVKELNRPPTDLALDNASVPENQPAGTPVGRFSATDPNEADPQVFTLVTGEGGEDNGLFTIQTNELRTAAVLDREAQATRTIRVETRDGAGNTFARAFTIAIADQSDTPPGNILLTPGAVAENQPAGTVVGQLAAVDADAGDAHTFALVAGDGSADNGSFVIQGNTVRTAAVFDYETKAAYSVRLQADDGHGGQSAQSLAILVLDEDDNQAPWNIALNSTCLPDPAPAGRAVGVLTAFDLNRDDVHTFALVSGEGDTDNASFRIDGRRLHTETLLEFAAHGPYTVRVQADDGHGGRFERAFRIVAAEVVWYDPFESGWGNWTHSASEGTDTWGLREEASRSPTHALTATGTSAPSDASAVSPWVTIPDDARQVRFQFFHRRDWGEFNAALVDGGVLEYRREGEPWWDILEGDTRGSWVIGEYQAAAPGPLGEPLAERQIWSGVTTGNFEQVTLALDAGYLAGQTVQFRWRQLVNSGGVERRWHVDDVLLAVERPNDPPPVLVLEVALTEVAEQLELTWTSTPGRQYTLEACTDLGNPAWLPAAAAVAGQPGASRTALRLDLPTLPVHPRKEIFFRVRTP